jgi:DNA-binding CsgD family transcriptional regulator
LIAEGKSSEEIAKILDISARTVKVHRANMMKKLDVHKVADMVKYAIKAGMVET